MRRIQKAGLKVKPSKRNFGKDNIEFLGFWVSEKGIEPRPEKVMAAQKFRPPTTINNETDFEVHKL